MTASRVCRDCGATFPASRADVTVRCQPCRAARKPSAVSPTSSVESDATRARAAVRKVRSQHGVHSVEFVAAMAEYVARFGDPSTRCR